jgi:hypothetical protein
MKLKIGQSRIESDFEFFVKALPALEPVEFLGLAKVLCVPTVRESKVLELSKEDLEKVKNGEDVDINIEETLVPADEILEAMMDKYLSLNKHRRGEINRILKDIKRSKKNEVKKNGPTT